MPKTCGSCAFWNINCIQKNKIIYKKQYGVNKMQKHNYDLKWIIEKLNEKKSIPKIADEMEIDHSLLRKKLKRLEKNGIIENTWRIKTP